MCDDFGGAGRRVVSGWSRRLAIILLAGMGLPWASALEPGIPRPAAYRTDRIIVRTVPGASAAALGQLHQRRGGARGRTFQHGRETQVVKLPPGRSVADALAAYRKDAVVESVEPDYLIQALIAPNDSRYQNQDQWNLHNTGIYGGVPGADVAAEAGWELRHDAGDIIVAVIDSGVRYTHEDLAGNMWVNPGENGLDSLGRNKRTNGLDDDANGYVDDVHGINVLNGSGDPFDDWGHGTHVAGIVGGVGNNGVGIAGVAWRVKIMACKFIDAAANYSVSDAIASLDYARRNGAKIVTASWGGYSFESPALRDAIGTLRESGIIVTAAAGNDNSNNDTMPLYPASYPFDNIVAVAATTRTDARAGYSNFGATTVDLGAPGSPVFSTWAGADNDYRYNEGTSMAAPHVAGACALLWARFPTDTYQQIIQRILTTVDPAPDLNGRTTSGGRLNLAAALASGTAPPPPPPPAILPAPTGLSAAATSESAITLAWTDQATTETGYEVQRSTDNATFIPSGSVGANVTSMSVGGLNAATNYFFRVRAVQGTTASVFSNTANATTASAPPPPPPPSGAWLRGDVGAVAAAGSDGGSGANFTVTGSGEDIWGVSDEFHYLYQSWNGDGTFVTQVTGLTNTDGWAKAGIMVRESLAPGARHAFISVIPNGTAGFFWRGAAGGATEFRSGGYSIARIWLKLVRTGNSFQAYQSGDGVTWAALGAAITVSLPSGVLAGLAVTSHRDGVLATGTFEQVAFGGGSAPPPPAPVTVNTPSALTAVAGSTPQISLTWGDTSDNETAFELQRSTDNVTFTSLATLATNATSHTDTGLAAATAYYYRLRAVAGATPSAWSNVASAVTPAGSAPPPATWSHADVGAVGVAGSDDAAGNTITVRGSGSDIWDRSDGFRYLYQALSGDGVVEAQVTSVTNTNGWAKAGVMIRESLAPGARNAFIFLTPSAGLHAQLRSTVNGTTSSTAGPWGLTVPYWVRLTRTGSTIVASASANGSTWFQVASFTLSLPADVLIGLAVTAHNNAQLSTATFEDPYIE